MPSQFEHHITIWDLEYHEVSDMLGWLAARDLQANRDFEFEFRPGFLNYEKTGQHRRSVTFRFPDSATATWFHLKYQDTNP